MKRYSLFRESENWLLTHEQSRFAAAPGTVVYIALVFVVVNLVVDISYAFIDHESALGREESSLCFLNRKNLNKPSFPESIPWIDIEYSSYYKR